MKKRIILIFLLGITSFLYAQQNTSFKSLLTDIKDLPQDKKSEKVESYFNSIKNFPIIDGSTVTFVVKGSYEKRLYFSAGFTKFREPAPMEKIEGLDVYYFTKELANNARIEYNYFHGEESFIDPLNPNKCWW